MFNFASHTKREWAFRMLLAVALAAATGTGDAHAQNNLPPLITPPTPTPAPAPPGNLPPLVIPETSHRDNSVWYALGGVLTAVVVGLVVKTIQANTTATPPARTLPPRQTITQFQGSLQGLGETSGGGGAAGGGAGGGGGVSTTPGAAKGITPVATLRGG